MWQGPTYHPADPDARTLFPDEEAIARGRPVRCLNARASEHDVVTKIIKAFAGKGLENGSFGERRASSVAKTRLEAPNEKKRSVRHGRGQCAVRSPRGSLPSIATCVRVSASFKLFPPCAATRYPEPDGLVKSAGGVR